VIKILIEHIINKFTFRYLFKLLQFNPNMKNMTRCDVILTMD